MHIEISREPPRGCGFRVPDESEVFRLYLCGGMFDRACGRLPYPLTACQACGGGIRLRRGYQKISPRLLFGNGTELRQQIEAAVIRALRAINLPSSQYNWIADQVAGEFGGRDVMACACPEECAGCPMDPVDLPEVAMLLNVGVATYPTRERFLREGRERGVSRRIHSIPSWFIPGETLVYVSHPYGLMPWERGYKAAEVEEVEEEQVGFLTIEKDVLVKDSQGIPAIIAVYRPHIEVTLRTDDSDMIPSRELDYLEGLESRFGSAVKFLKVEPIEDEQGTLDDFLNDDE